MARPREFDTDDALEAAMQVFWRHGYQDASLPDLLEGMGLTRGSLYKAFKDKKNLFLLVLDRYETAAVDGAVEVLRDRSITDGSARITGLFAGVVAASEGGDHRGCLLCTAAAGAAADDTDIAKAVHIGMAKMQKGFEYALGDAPQLEGLADADRLRLANVLLTQYIGLRMLVRSRLPLGVLEGAVRGIEDILRPA